MNKLLSLLSTLFSLLRSAAWAARKLFELVWRLRRRHSAATVSGAWGQELQSRHGSVDRDPWVEATATPGSYSERRLIAMRSKGIDPAGYIRGER
jgi:hypothetical protein